MKKMQSMFDAYYEHKQVERVKDQFAKEEKDRFKGKTSEEIKKIKEADKKREQAEAEKAAMKAAK